MKISYKPLWKTLIDKNMSKKELRLQAHLTTNHIANMGKGEHISMQTLIKICESELYAALLMEGRLFAHLLDVEDTANGWLDRMIPQMAKSAGATEELKARDQMAWVGLMNNCKVKEGRRSIPINFCVPFHLSCDARVSKISELFSVICPTTLIIRLLLLSIFSRMA